jgi:hypothetical protein
MVAALTENAGDSTERESPNPERGGKPPMAKAQPPVSGTVFDSRGIATAVDQAAARVSAPLPSAKAAPVSAPVPLPMETPIKRVPDQVTLRLDAGGPLDGHLRLAVRGGRLHATITTATPDVAAMMEHQLPELKRSLAERGFANPRILVQQGPSASEMKPQGSYESSERREHTPRNRDEESGRSREHGHHGRQHNPRGEK